jgi:ethanolaminephosphotransferase
LTFYIQTWDEYHTKTLTLGIVSGPVEGILTLCFVYATTAFVGGGSFWNRPILETLNYTEKAWMPAAIYNMSWVDSYMLYGGLMMVANTLWR